MEDAGYEEFEILQEGWNLYRLKDGSTLKTRIVLIKLVRGVPDEQGNITYAVNSTNLIGMMAPRSLRGPGSTRVYSPQELNSSVVEDDIEYEMIKEEWNRYRLKNETVISMKLALVKVSRTNKFDANGEPIYLVNTQPIIKANLPKDMREKTVTFASKQPPSFTV